MATIMTTLQFFLLVLNLITGILSNPQRRTFIVHVARSEKPSLFTSHHDWYTSVLSALNHPSPGLVYTYEKAINGFSATLTASQAEKIKAIPGVLSVLPEKTHRLATTHTYKFIGLSDADGLWPASNYGDGIVIGILDTGIWPERRSFSDMGMSPVPSWWRGKCESSKQFPASSCNRKIIGARAFNAGYLISRSNQLLSARDEEGHGTHVASTAAGAAVSNASFYGFARGEARGVAPRAHIAIYKVCHDGGCGESDILAGIEQAIADGVNIISMSITGGISPYHRSNVAIATFGAMEHGILFSAAASNSGPKQSTVNHLAPWALTVGASSVNREFRADVFLGDGRTFIGDSLYYGNPLSTFYQLVYAGDFGNKLCSKGNFLRKWELAGKIVVCEGGGHPMRQSEAVKSVNGVGMILTNMANRGEELRAEPHYIVPTTRVSHSDGAEIKRYIGWTTNATANILFRGTVIGPQPPAPKVAAFSSRGPNPLTPQILKPDVLAPGLNILAAWSGAGSPWGLGSDPRRVQFNVISGTSMACPHVSGLAALLKSARPGWSPAAIKSAIMTTSYDLDNSGSLIKDLATGNESTPFVHGSGHVDPNRALNPGLVYDMNVNDYVAFLCSIGYDSAKLKIFLKRDVRDDECQKMYAAIGARVTPGDLNYPSFSVVFNHIHDNIKYRRSVTNVGARANAVYKVSVKAPLGVRVKVLPGELAFDANNRTNKFEVTFSSSGEYSGSSTFGSIEWTDGEHHVRSPVAIRWANTSPSTISSPLRPVASI